MDPSPAPPTEIRNPVGTARPVAVAVPPERVDWLPNLPFFLLHLSVPAVFLVGWSPVALWIALGLYLLRMFFITAFYHRYFSHKAYRVSRPVQFLMSLAGTLAVQRGALWWAAHHRFHHAHSDEDVDSHSPRHGFWWSHMFWFLTKSGSHTRERLIPDFRRFPELLVVERWFLVPPLLLAVALFGFGALAATRWPQLGTNGWQMLVWAFGVSTVALYHGTYTINSVAHVWGRRRYETNDTSRNNFFLAILTLGEGWHNNHHHFSAAARQGFYWWEIDLSWYALWVLEKLRIVRDLKPVPAYVRDERPGSAERGSPA